MRLFVHGNMVEGSRIHFAGETNNANRVYRCWVTRHWEIHENIGRCTEVLTYLLTYLLSPRSGVLPEQLTGSQPVQKFSAIYGTRRFITAFTSARHLSLSWARSIQSIPPYPTSWSSMFIYCVYVFTVLFIVCTVFFFVLFRLCIFILICFVCSSVRTNATEWQLNWLKVS